MSPSPPPARKSASNRHALGERRSVTVRSCQPCHRRRRPCNGQRPCMNCSESNIDCVYSVVSDLPRSVFTTSSARRLSSGSACEICRKRKTKCDGGSPCGFCLGAGLGCYNNSERRKRSMGIPGSTGQTNSASDAEAMDRIEDRLRRIEKLMTAFTPAANSPLANSSSSSLENSNSIMPTSPPRVVRQYRHSVQGISVAKEQAELHTAFALQRSRAGILIMNTLISFPCN